MLFGSPSGSSVKILNLLEDISDDIRFHMNKFLFSPILIMEAWILPNDSSF